MRAPADPAHFSSKGKLQTRSASASVARRAVPAAGSKMPIGMSRLFTPNVSDSGKNVISGPLRPIRFVSG